MATVISYVSDLYVLSYGRRCRQLLTVITDVVGNWIRDAMAKTEAHQVTACGCVKGRFNCPEAVRLWDKVADAHKPLAAALNLQNDGAYSRTLRLRASFDAAYAAYEAHIAAAESQRGVLL